MKKIILIVLISFGLTGCGKEEKISQDLPLEPDIYQNEEYDNNEELKNNEEVIKEENKKPETNSTASNKPNLENEETINQTNLPNLPNETNNVSDKKETNSSANEPVYSSEDLIVINSLETINQNVDNLLKEEKSEDNKNKLKGVFITFVDFIFYDGEIKGVTFNELTQEGKSQVLKLINAIDEKIEKHFPGYKETISDKASKAYSKASEIIKNGANNIKEFAQEKLGDEYYQEIIDAKDELVIYTKNAFSLLGDFSSSLFNNVKDKLSNWYENFKNNN